MGMLCGMRAVDALFAALSCVVLLAGGCRSVSVDTEPGVRYVDEFDLSTSRFSPL